MLSNVVALLVCGIAVFCVLDVFRPYRERIVELTPDSVKKSANYVTNKVASLFGRQTGSVLVFTKEELAKYDGSDGGKVYLALLGEVFDVTRGKKHYGPSGGYHGFAAKDGTRAFVSGEFNEKGLIEDVDGLDIRDYRGIEDWRKFYHKDYSYVGKLVGKYYDTDGNPTEAFHQYEIKLAESEKEKEKENEDMLRYPPCNSEFKQDAGRRIWCTEWSGGIKRDWVGVPRQYYKPGKTQARCACVKDKGPPSDKPDGTKHRNVGDLDNPAFKVYEGCDPMSVSCSFPK